MHHCKMRGLNSFRDYHINYSDRKKNPTFFASKKVLSRLLPRARGGMPWAKILRMIDATVTHKYVIIFGHFFNIRIR